MDSICAGKYSALSAVPHAVPATVTAGSGVLRMDSLSYRSFSECQWVVECYLKTFHDRPGPKPVSDPDPSRVRHSCSGLKIWRHKASKFRSELQVAQTRPVPSDP